jgi:hypothetical protein
LGLLVSPPPAQSSKRFLRRFFQKAASFLRVGHLAQDIGAITIR